MKYTLFRSYHSFTVFYYNLRKDPDRYTAWVSCDLTEHLLPGIMELGIASVMTYEPHHAVTVVIIVKYINNNNNNN